MGWQRLPRIANVHNKEHAIALVLKIITASNSHQESANFRHCMISIMKKRKQDIREIPLVVHASMPKTNQLLYMQGFFLKNSATQL